MPDENAESTPEQPPEPGPDETPPAAGQEGEQGKVHVDADWKAEAKAEKDRLARETQPRGGAAVGDEAAAEAAAGAAGAGRLPPASFAALVQTLATQAAIFLSDEKDPQSGRPLRNLDLAKHNIDLLAVLEEKTRGNLSEEEQRLLDRYLYELRMAYVATAS